VSLSGDGGDELFAGYSQYPDMRRYRLVDWFPRAGRQFIAGIGSQLVPEHKRPGGFMRRLGAPAEARYLSLVSNPTDGRVMGALSGLLRGFLSDPSLDGNWQSNYWSENSTIEAQVVDQRTYLPDDILAKVDISSMSVSLEARVPLLDHVLADQVNKLPTSYKLRNGQSKRLLKHIAAPLLPKRIIDRPKGGFAIPLRSWLMGPMRRSVEELLLENPSGLFDGTGLEAVMDAMETGDRPATRQQVWKLLCLSIWANRQGESRPF
jgi:asparagine synthase (glutamine-hydrolysing)